MLSLVRGSKTGEDETSLDENRVLLDEFRALDPVRQDEAAEKLAVLWHCFVEVFGNPARFHGEPRGVQDAYIAKFEQVASRSYHVRHSETGHLHYSVAFMLRFLLAARGDDRRQSALDLSNHMAGLINRVRDRQLEATRNSIAEALSKPAQGSPGIGSTGMGADNSLEFPMTGDDPDTDQGMDRDR
jgi:hypothetical protein